MNNTPIGKLLKNRFFTFRSCSIFKKKKNIEAVNNVYIIIKSAS